MKQDLHSATGVTTNTPEELSVTKLTPPPSDEVYVMPATQGQIRFWSLDQIHPGNPALNMPLMWQCRGELNVDLLAAAFTQAVRRHEMLRTTFSMIDGNLSQIIGKPYSVALPVKDLQHVPDAANSPEAGTLIRDHAAYRMDLRSGPLLVLKLLKFTPHHHLLLVTMHHIICDGISLGILLRDIAVFYEALVEGKQPDPICRLCGMAGGVEKERRCQGFTRFLARHPGKGFQQHRAAARRLSRRRARHAY
jgi:hypothetical protein